MAHWLMVSGLPSHDFGDLTRSACGCQPEWPGSLVDFMNSTTGSTLADQPRRSQARQVPDFPRASAKDQLPKPQCCCSVPALYSIARVARLLRARLPWIPFCILGAVPQALALGKITFHVERN